MSNKESIKSNAYKKIEKVAVNAKTVDAVNAAVINQLQVMAPEEEAARKISEEELLKNIDGGEDVYKKYFK